MGNLEMVIGPEKFKGVFALVPTCSTPDADKPASKNTFARENFEKLLHKLIRDGIHGIITTGSLGECHTLTWDEHKELIDTAVEVVDGRVPLVIGTTSINTRQAIRKTKYVEKVGADAIMNGPPMYISLSLTNTIRYYKDLAEACPNVGIMIYSNPAAFKVEIPPNAYHAIKKIDNVVAVKETIPGAVRLMNECRICGDDISVMTMDRNMFPSMLYGATGCTSFNVCLGPQPVLKLYEACRKEDWKKAAEIANEIASLRLARGGASLMYLVNRVHIMANLAGYCQTGPARRPFAVVPKEVKENCELFVRRWKELVAKYS